MAASSTSRPEGGASMPESPLPAPEQQDSILEPLSFPEAPPPESWPSGAGLVCLLCSDSTPLADTDRLLKHLLLQHKLVIADVKMIADLPRYLLYWKGRFLEQPITEFCSVIKTNSEGPLEKQEFYFLLCDVLPEDRVLRETLQQNRLERVLEQQQRERDDGSFTRTCLFCIDIFTGNRASLLNHMARDHSFSVGLPDNIVFCGEFLDLLQSKLDKLQCLYCEKTFRDKTTLKDHMRKKAHRRINASNQEYDRFYIINYLELGKTWEEVQSEEDGGMVEEEEDWSDWRSLPVSAVCLFCEQRSESLQEVHTHMQEAHGFDLQRLKTDLSLRFYQQVKLVNFVRRQLHQGRCYGCTASFSCKAEVVDHMTSSGHVMRLTDSSAWDQPQYFFPTYENDSLLCVLTDSDGEAEGADPPVLPEELSHLHSLKHASVLQTLLRQGGH